MKYAHMCDYKIEKTIMNISRSRNLTSICDYKNARLESDKRL